MKRLILAGALSFVMTVSAIGEDKQELSPGVMSQVVLSEQLIALGKERNDPVLLLAALKLRKSFTNKVLQVSDEWTTDAALDEAIDKVIGDNAELAEIAKDVRASKSRLAGYYCFTSTSGQLICHN